MNAAIGSLSQIFSMNALGVLVPDAFANVTPWAGSSNKDWWKLPQKTISEETSDLVGETQVNTISHSARDQHIASQLAALFSGQQNAIRQNHAAVTTKATTQDILHVDISAITTGLCKGNHI